MSNFRRGRPRRAEELLGSAGVARVLGVSTARVRQLAREGRLDALKTANGRLYRPKDVEQLRLELGR